MALDLGALKETAMGFADLLPVTADMDDAKVTARYKRFWRIMSSPSWPMPETGRRNVSSKARK